MISRLHPSIPPIALILLASLTFWMTNAIVPLMTMQMDDLHHKQPDYIVENLTGIRVDHDSTVQRIFSAKKLIHYLDGDITYLEQPYFINIEPKKHIMRLKAEKAELSGNGENIFLSGNVTVLRGADSDHDKVTMLTSFLHLIPDANIAKTDKTAVIARKNTTINTIGLELDSHTGIIQLLSRVRAVDN